MSFRYLALAPVLLIVLAIGALGCNSAEHPTAPSGTTLTMTASSTKIGLSDSAQITVTGFRPDGNRLPEGTLIRFSASLGTIEPAVTTIGADGIARAVFRADGRAGTATVTANLSTGSTGGGGEGEGGEGGAGAGTGTESASVSIEVSAETPTLLISANPTIIDLEETSVVTITARDENSLPLGSGHEILLTSNLGTLRKGGQTVDSIETESDGRARVDFVAGTEVGDGSVNALLRNSEPVSVTITIREAPENLSFNISANEISSSGGTVTLTATVTSANSRPVAQVGVTFVTGLGTLSASVDVTDGAGVATSTLTVTQSDIDNFAGSQFNVTASFSFDGDTKSVTRTITIAGGGT